MGPNLCIFSPVDTILHCSLCSSFTCFSPLFPLLSLFRHLFPSSMVLSLLFSLISVSPSINVFLPLFYTLSLCSSSSLCSHPCPLVTHVFLVFTVLSSVCFFAHFTSPNFHHFTQFTPCILPAPIVCLFFERKKTRFSFL